LVVWIALNRNTKDSPTEIEGGSHAEAHVEEAAPMAETPARTAEAPMSEVEAEPRAETPAAAPVKPVKLDDLTIIEGIGPKVSGLLNSAGIMTLGELAETDPERLKEILEKEGLQFMDPGSWKEQARLAAEGKLADLEVLKQSLKAGRRNS
jgi:predicted flap endonuclease-1-like 5' DNA nuclease